MFNLLSKKEQYNLSNEYRLRFVAVALFFIGSIGVMALGVLVPSFFLSHQKKLAVEKYFETLNHGALVSDRKLADVMVVAENEIKAIQMITPVIPTYELIADIVRVKPKSIKISGIHVTKNQNSGRSIALVGKALDRDSLLSFAKTLEQVKNFTKVTVPVSNFVEPKNISYSIIVDAK